MNDPPIVIVTCAPPPFVRRGRGEPPEPSEHGSEVISLRTCPDCNGRGYFLINPFATGGSNGAGGVGNLTRCLTCKDAEAYWKRYGILPAELTGTEEAMIG